MLSSVDTGACKIYACKSINTCVRTMATNKNVLSKSRVKTDMMLPLERRLHILRKLTYIDLDELIWDI